MDTAKFQSLRPEHIPKALSILVRAMPYLVMFITALLALGLAADAQNPRGITRFISDRGISLPAYALVTALVVLLGALTWHRARKTLFWSCVLCVFIMLPIIGYCLAGTFFLTGPAPGSNATLAIFLGCTVFGALLLAIIVLLAAWVAVSVLLGRLHE